MNYMVTYNAPNPCFFSKHRTLVSVCVCGGGGGYVRVLVYTRARVDAQHLSELDAVGLLLTKEPRYNTMEIQATKKPSSQFLRVGREISG